eukprot:360969-Chlamydomonas_euryale.AAC.2
MKDSGVCVVGRGWEQSTNQEQGIISEPERGAKVGVQHEAPPRRTSMHPISRSVKRSHSE